ncbi:hypothetical protein [Zavarzinella formosa]|uniref:hypothetical protein n=1 Tax=Zavarzinella formosa TaxID=360055 RepID=UPI0002EA7346|nr:hypothetical protein [Zavarzinella formosa]
MLFDATFENYLSRRPAAVMVRAAFEHAFAPDDLNDLFERTCQTQYTRQITFGTVVSVLEAVAFRRHPSVRSSFFAPPRSRPRRVVQLV